MLSVIKLLGCLFLLLVVGLPRLASAQSAADVAAGKVLYGHLCVTCHGIDGGGGVGPPLNRAKLVNAPDDAALRAIIADGIPSRGMPRVLLHTASQNTSAQRLFAALCFRPTMIEMTKEL